jgi:hypothetical protein
LPTLEGIQRLWRVRPLALFCQIPHLPVKPAVETVEKATFQKLIFKKWVINIEKCSIFCVPNNILAIFEPVVGDFCEGFSNKGFFDSLVRPRK